MSIPSYDDLTLSIPDISTSDVFASTAALLPQACPIAERSSARSTEHRARSTQHAAPSTQHRATLFAALHGVTSDRLVAIARDFSPRIERYPGGSVVLDVAGLQRLLGDAPAIAADLAQAGAPHVAIATSQMAALLLARAGAGVTVATGDPEAALRDLPIAVLQQLLADIETADEPPSREASAARRSLGKGGSWKLGVGAMSCAGPAFDVLRRWGLTTIGEFAALPAPDLSARLGREGVAIQRLARGIDPRPLMPDPDVTRFIESCELEWPLEAIEPLSFVFARLLDPLAAALERADRGAVAVHLTLRLTDRTSHVRTLQLPVAMRDPRVLRTLLLLDLEWHPPSAAVDVVSIELDPAPARVVQYSLLERAVPSPETLATLMARLGALVGDTRCGSPVLLDTHRPDGFVMAPVAFGEIRNAPTPNFPLPPSPRLRRAAEASREGGPTPKALCSKARGESRGNMPVAEDFHTCRSSQSLWELGVGSWELTQAPDTPPPPALRRFRPPVAIRVAVEGGRPVRVAIDRQRMPGGIVQQAAGPWRTSGGWWETKRWNRDEWDVALSDGAVCRLFHDRDSDGWFLDGVFD